MPEKIKCTFPIKSTRIDTGNVRNIRSMNWLLLFFQIFAADGEDKVQIMFKLKNVDPNKVQIQTTKSENNIFECELFWNAISVISIEKIFVSQYAAILILSRKMTEKTQPKFTRR